jgi:DNA-binding GntR family transcriptional regulator
MADPTTPQLDPNVAPIYTSAVSPGKRSLDPRAAEARPQASVDDLAREIQARILDGEIPVGSWLRQETLAAEFHVSRTPVREALQKLEATGVVQLVRHRGALVRGPTVREIREAYQVRAELEGLAAELAAAWIGDEQLERLREAAEAFRATAAGFAEHPGSRNGNFDREIDDELVRLNDAFHELIQEAAGNERLRETIRDLHRSFPRNATAALRRSSRRLRETVEQHQEILDAIGGGDGPRARRAMVGHVSSSGVLVAAMFERGAS